MMASRCSSGQVLAPRRRFVLGAAFIFLISLMCTGCDGHSSKRLPLAGIFGLGGKKEEQQPPPPQYFQSYPPQRLQKQQRQNQRQLSSPPPPGRRPPLPQSARDGRPLSQNVRPEVRNGSLLQRPPPPPPSEKGNPPLKVEEDQKAEDKEEVESKGGDSIVAEADDENAAQESVEVQEESKQPPPPPPQWGAATSYQQTPPVQGWMGPPPTEYGRWEAAPYYEGQGNEIYLQEELDESLARETDLIVQLDNLTAAIVVMEQREELHMRQLDVLTERVMDVEAQGAEDRNRLIEYETNCTALGQSIATLNEELGEWQNRCKEFTERHEEDQETLSDLKKTIKEKSTEAEELAMVIENLRLAEQREASRSQKQKKGGLLTWLLSFFFNTKDQYEEVSREEAYDMARSTLLRALQSERGNVHELEAVVTSLQQNNSAIAEMVESRDTIIDELNNRIAVFEEDKVVLKAALRQLQKEIKEEAPRTQKLIDSVAEADKEVKRLNAELNGIIQMHQEEVLKLQKTISIKQKAISESESNMTTIGTYVDKLEERLTSFAIKRRDMEERETKCKEIEASVAITETEKQKLQAKVDEFTKEQGELKKLLEELASERTNLQKDNRKLLTEREFRISAQEQMQARCAELEKEMKTLSQGEQVWKEKCEILTPALESAESLNTELQSRLVRMGDVQKELGEYRSRNAEIQGNLEEIEAELHSLRSENERLEAFVNKTKAEEEEKSKNAVKASSPSVLGTSPLSQSRDVPFRTIRKRLSKVTGIHGVFTPSSRMSSEKKPQNPLLKKYKQILQQSSVKPNGKIPDPPLPPPL